MHWNKTERFVIRVVSQTKVLVKPEAVGVIRDMLREMNDDLNYDPPVAGEE